LDKSRPWTLSELQQQASSKWILDDPDSEDAMSCALSVVVVVAEATSRKMQAVQNPASSYRLM
jgi:hypothetical protein